MSDTDRSPAAPSAAAPVPANRRKPALWAVTAVTLAVGVGCGAWWFLTQRAFETTDNAYVQAPVVQITPQVGGTVVAVLADDTDAVREGQPLVRLDPSDAKLAVDRAEAQLGQTVREVRTLYANNATLDATIRLREAEVTRVQAELARADADVARRQPLLASGAVGGEEMQHALSLQAGARGALASAQAGLAAAQQQAAGNRALTEGTAVAQHPNVERAAAAVREAWLALQRTELPAPVAGQVARRSVQVGQRVAPGAPLMSVIPLEQVWVEANFKEVQLRRMRIGQPVELSADLYGRQVHYRGHVAGLGAGTGAAFALLPAQNATGNWIKVVQRVPVRVALEPQDLAAHPLRVGLSMEAQVDVSAEGGAPLLGDAAPNAAAPNAAAASATAASTRQTHVFDAATADADRRVQAIIAGHLGHPVAAARTHAAAPVAASAHP